MGHDRQRTDDNVENYCTKCGKHDPHLTLENGQDTTCIDDNPSDYSPTDPSFLL